MRAMDKGRRLEHRARAILRDAGFRVIRAAGSKGVFDLAAFDQEAIWLLQVKSNKWPSPAEVGAMREFPAPASVRRFVWRFDDRREYPHTREVK